MRKTAASLIACLFIATGPSWAELPYAKHGLTSEEAAAHMLDRFSMGPEPGEVHKVSRQGLENWLDRQLQGRFSNTDLKEQLATLPPAYEMNNTQIVAKYPNPGRVRKMAKEEGLMTEDGKPNRREMRAYLEKKGLRPFQELGATLFGQKLYHARYNENGLQEVMTEFWFNHFNVAMSNNRARSYILSYERDVIRPNSLGNFRQLLGATAKHPAMLFYLDNANSTAGAEVATTTDAMMDDMVVQPRRAEKMNKRLRKRKKGVNENYARELMELHTLGVEGGYTQKDVEEVARAFTGWTATPPRRAKKARQMAKKGAALGFKVEGDFIFAAGLHDAGSKKILGRRYPAGGGMEEGEQVLDMLAAHPSTARHLAQKLAVRFISDDPSEATVKHLAKVFQRSRGDTGAVLKAIAQSDEFWRSRSSKVKSPFELLVSAARALDADIEPTKDLYGWLVSMGQPLYNYKAPTGFPDKASFWVSSGTVLNRVNFGLQIGSGKVQGFRYKPVPTNSMDVVVRRLLPTHEARPIVAKLQPLFDNPESIQVERPKRKRSRFSLGNRRGQRMSLTPEERETATMVGLVLGSPEFQRR